MFTTTTIKDCWVTLTPSQITAFEASLKHKLSFYKHKLVLMIAYDEQEGQRDARLSAAPADAAAAPQELLSVSATGWS